MLSPANDNPADLLLGADAIARYLGVKRHQTYRMIYDGHLPTFKVGGTVAARRSRLAAWLEEQEEKAA